MSISQIGSGGRIRLPRGELERIRGHALADYPHECCGVLVGRSDAIDGGVHSVMRTVAVENACLDERGTRYLIPPDGVRSVAARAREDGLKLVGFYHSHPDHPPEPSARDRAFAWPWYSYVIVGVSADSVGRVRAWRLSGDRAGFTEDDLVITEDMA